MPARANVLRRYFSSQAARAPRRVVVTGASVRTWLGKDVEQLFDAVTTSPKGLKMVSDPTIAPKRIPMGRIDYEVSLDGEIKRMRVGVAPAGTLDASSPVG